MGVKRKKKIPKWKKKKRNYICHTPYLRNSIEYDHFFWYTCAKWWYFQVFFVRFFKSLILWVASWVKVQKMAQNVKKNLSHSISQEWNIIWFSFMVHFCEIISPGVFLIFSKFWFSGLLGGCKREKAVQYVKKFCLLYSISQEPYIILLHLWYTYVKWWYLQGCFLFIQNCDFVGCWEGKKAKNRPKWEKLCLSHSISHKSYIIFSFMVHMWKMIMSPGVFFIISKFWFSVLLGG